MFLFSTGDAVTPGWNLFQWFDVIDTTSKSNYNFAPRSTHGAAETNRINTVGIQC